MNPTQNRAPRSLLDACASDNRHLAQAIISAGSAGHNEILQELLRIPALSVNNSPTWPRAQNRALRPLLGASASNNRPLAQAIASAGSVGHNEIVQELLRDDQLMLRDLLRYSAPSSRPTRPTAQMGRTPNDFYPTTTTSAGQDTDQPPGYDEAMNMPRAEVEHVLSRTPEGAPPPYSSVSNNDGNTGPM